MVRPDGTNLRKIHIPLVGLQDVHHYAWSPDSKHVAFQIHDGEPMTTRLFVWTVGSGGTAFEVSTGIVGGRSVESDFAWAPDSSRIAYRSDSNIDDVWELFTAVPGGPGPVRVCANLPIGRSVSTTRWWDLAGGSGVGFGFAWSWSPTSSALVYVADQDTHDLFEIYTTPADGSAPPVKLNGSVHVGDELGAPRWSPTGTHIAFGMMGATPLLLVHRPGNTTGMQVSGTLTAGGNVGSWTWGP